MKRLFLLISLTAIAIYSNAQNLSVQDIEASVGDEAELVVSLAGGTQMSALQFNLHLPEGVSFAESGDTHGATLGTATSDHTLRMEPLTNGDLLVILYSMDLTPFTDGELLRIPLAAGSEALSSEGQLYKVRTATTDAVSHTCGDVAFDIEWELRAFTLADDADNTATLTTWNGKEADVTLGGRTLYKDNDWNTLCLPFDVTIAGSPLEGATVKTLSSSSFSEGTLTLNFTNANSIEAGKPYIVKWETVGENLVNPVFEDVTVGGAATNVVTSYVTMCGTYSPVSFNTENRSILILGAGSSLFYPDGSAPSYVNAFRAYFQLADGYTAGDTGSNVKAVVMNFEDTPTGISLTPSPSPKSEGSEEWYALDGRRVSTPTKGTYIVNGKKVYIK